MDTKNETLPGLRPNMRFQRRIWTFEKSNELWEDCTPEDAYQAIKDNMHVGTPEGVPLYTDADQVVARLIRQAFIVMGEQALRLYFVFVPGECIYHSWGYGQTNVNFYKIVRRTAKSVWIQECQNLLDPTYVPDGDLSSRRIPGEPFGKVMRKAIKQAYHSPSELVYFEYGGMTHYRGNGVYESYTH